ncbi:MAG: SRPBCC domain-containing protein [Pseudomonadota bacterium]
MPKVNTKRHLAFPVEMVWDAITDRDQLAEWLMPNDFQLELGHRFTFTTKPAPGFDGTVHSEVLAIEPNRRLVLAWRAGALDTTVEFVLSSVDGGTILELLHEGFKLGEFIPYFILGQGWKSLLKRKLPNVLASNSQICSAA